MTCCLATLSAAIIVLVLNAIGLQDKVWLLRRTLAGKAASLTAQYFMPKRPSSLSISISFPALCATFVYHLSSHIFLYWHHPAVSVYVPFYK